MIRVLETTELPKQGKHLNAARGHVKNSVPYSCLDNAITQRVINRKLRKLSGCHGY